MIELTKYKIDNDLFINKIKEDLSKGVEINSSDVEDTVLIRVWTDSENWEFIVVGLYKGQVEKSLKAVEIQSIGNSKVYIKMTLNLKDEAIPLINVEKLADSFAQMQTVEDKETEDFIDSYLTSSFNTTKTAELFNELAGDQNYFNWLKY